jgi:Zn-dependent metalloprotease
MMCSSDHHNAGLICCSIIPPHVLEHVVRAPGASEKQRIIAFNTLKAMDRVHRAREALGRTALASCGISSSIGDRSLAGSRPLIPSYVYSEISNAEGASEETKERLELNIKRLSDLQNAGRLSLPLRPVPEHLLRLVRDAHQTNDQTGDLVIRNDREREASTDEGANRIWDYLGQIFKFFSEVYGRNSIDDKALPLIATVHWDDDNGITPGYMNAFWDPRTAEWYFGDGDRAIFDDFTKPIDIVAHEYSHAVTQFTANLPYQWQSGALNEHFSDVFGSLIKQYYRRQRAVDADWLIGQGIFLNEKAPALRSMKAPGTAYDWPEVVGKDPQPADMDGYRELPMSRDNGGVHIYSGIPNRAFYLVATTFGGDAWVKAGKIWYHTLIDPDFKALFDPEKVSSGNLELNSKNAFRSMADLTCRHAERLYGQEGVKIVRDAWTDVKVLSNLSKL